MFLSDLCHICSSKEISLTIIIRGWLINIQKIGEIDRWQTRLVAHQFRAGWYRCILVAASLQIRIHWNVIIG